jgi:hypothetical protein
MSQRSVIPIENPSRQKGYYKEGKVATPTKKELMIDPNIHLINSKIF